MSHGGGVRGMSHGGGVRRDELWGRVAEGMSHGQEVRRDEPSFCANMRLLQFMSFSAWFPHP